MESLSRPEMPLGFVMWSSQQISLAAYSSSKKSQTNGELVLLLTSLRVRKKFKSATTIAELRWRHTLYTYIIIITLIVTNKYNWIRLEGTSWILGLVSALFIKPDGHWGYIDIIRDIYLDSEQFRTLPAIWHHASSPLKFIRHLSWVHFYLTWY